MPQIPGFGRAPGRAPVRDTIVIVAGVVLLHLALAARFPIIYGGDTILRLVNFPRIRISYQLPLLQILLHPVQRWFDVADVWFLMALIAAAGAVGLYGLALAVFDDQRAARIAALIYACHPFVLFYGRVPYQEPLLLASLVWGFRFLFLGRPAAASLALGAAALTRYEGWLAAPAAAAYWVARARAREGRITARALVESIGLFTWAPALWIASNRGLSPAGTFLLDFDFSWARMYRPYFIVKSALWWSDAALVALALLGVARAITARRSRSDAPVPFLILFVLGFFAVLVFSGHGIAPDPERFVTEREAFVPVGFLALFAGVGAGHLAAVFGATGAPGRLLGAAALAVVAGYGLARGTARVAAANAEPELRTDYAVARFLAEAPSTALVFAPPLPRSEIEAYVERAGRSGGEAGRARARALLDSMVMAPFDHQRIVVHAWRSRGRITSSDALRGLGREAIREFLRERQVGYAVVFSDFTPQAEHERNLLALVVDGRQPEREWRHGSKGAKVYVVGPV